MYPKLNLQNKVFTGLLLSASLAVASADGLTKAGGEYRFLQSLAGDQMLPNISFNSKGGYLVTQDNSIDGDGLGIRARKYYPDFSGARWTFPVNSVGKGEQQNARVAMLEDGGAVFAWQGSTPTGNRIFVRSISSTDTFTAQEQTVSSSAVGNQSDPSLAVLVNQSAVVTWTEWDRDGDMQGIFAQRLSSSGQRLGETFRVNQYTKLSQRTPAVAALKNGNFVVAWVSDEQRIQDPVVDSNQIWSKASIDIYARIFASDGLPVTDEFLLNSTDRICANPTLFSTASGFRAAWSARNRRLTPTNWDVETRLFSNDGSPAGTEFVVNNVTLGDQFSPRIGAAGTGQVIVWTSYGQDGSDEGIFARAVGSGGPEGQEFQVNTRTINKQINPMVASSGQTIVIVWASFMGGLESYDLFGQNYTLSADAGLAAPAAPFVSSLSQNSICVSWPEAVSQSVDRYLIYIDDESRPEESVGGMLVITRATWQASSSHSIKLGYRTTDGRVSPSSSVVTARTWGADGNSDGLPDEWQTENWGKRWPSASEDSDADGASNVAEFLAGTDPTDAQSVLRLEISARERGPYLQWNTQPGSFYQLQVTSNFTSWENVGTPRFAPSTSEALPLTVPGQVQYYRVIRMR